MTRREWMEANYGKRPAQQTHCHRAGVTLISPIGLRHSCETYLEGKGTTELFQIDRKSVV